MGLIREINEALDTQIKQEAEYLSNFAENVTTLFEGEHLTELFETAEQFLTQVADMIKSGKSLDQEQANAIGAKVAALQLLADPGTSSSALSVIAGSDNSKKLSTIMKQASGADQPIGQVDKVLIALANRVGKSGVTANAQLLSSVGGMDEKARETKANELIGLANTFQKLEGSIQQAPEQPPAQTPTTNQGNQPSGQPTGNAPAPAGI